MKNHDGWGMTPKQEKAFKEAVKKADKKDQERRSNAKFWIATFSHVQGHTKITKRFPGTEEEAMKRAINHFGKPDGWNTFISLKPTI